MHKVRILLGLALVTLVCAAPAFAVSGPFTLTDNPDVADAVVTIYDPATGDLSSQSNGLTMTSYQITSGSDAFNVDNIDPSFGVNDPFKVIAPGKLFTLQTGGVTEVPMGNVLAPGLTADALLADLETDGSLSPSGTHADAAGGGPFLYIVPEPSSILLTLCGLLGMLSLRRK